MTKQIVIDIFSPKMQGALLATAIMATCGASSALAQESTAVTPFDLGTVYVTAPMVVVTATRSQVGQIGEDQVASVVTREDMRKFNRDNVGDALNLLSGITLSNNLRNEKMINLRGLDVREVPLFIDGIPVYVPYDGYIDFNRFTTADLAAIQVAKGFSSVAYGPNALGGAINLISRKPKSKFEGDASVGFASGSQRQAQVNVGTNQGQWYLQAGASYLKSDNFPLSSDFKPTATENGGARNNSYRKDQKVSFKVGLTPNVSDEYAFSYYKQEGEKGQPPSTVPTARYWKWPQWDTEGFSFISKTALGNFENAKVRLYHDSYDNEVDSFTNGNYTTLKTSGSGSVGTGRSIYHDWTDGGSLELESMRFNAQTLRFFTQYKADNHKEKDATGKLNTEFKDALVSYALEDNIQFNPALMLSLGLGQHKLRPEKVFSSSPYSLPSVKTANNAQAGLYYDWTEAARLYATVAKKTRLPTLKDRYSQRLGAYIENPNLQPEESVNYEVGYQGQPWQGAKAEAAVFYSDISDKIQAVTVAATPACVAPCSQQQNVGKVRSSGIELGLHSPVAAWIELGGNYTYIDLKNVSNPTTKLTDVPKQKLTVDALFHLGAATDVIAYAEHDSSRWASNTVELAGFTTLNLKAVYRPAKNISTEAGVTNLADKNYSLADGFPNPGRMWFANASYQF